MIKHIRRIILEYLLYVTVRMVLIKYKPFVINITGSVGKTSTKEYIKNILTSKYDVLETRLTRNTSLSLPAEVLRIDICNTITKFISQIPHIFKILFGNIKFPKILILEISTMRKKGGIRHFTNMTRPKIGIVTKIAPSHIEYFGSIEEITKQKQILVEELPKEGTAILNYDDDYIRQMKDFTKAKVLYYGLNPKADVWAEKVKVTENGLQFILHYKKNYSFVEIPGIFNMIMIYSVLAAIACGFVFNLEWKEIIINVRKLNSIKNRGNIIKKKNKDITLINDSYNSNPVSCTAALENLEMLGKNKYKIAVLGDMLELGDYTEEGHREVGKKAAEIANQIICVGENSKYIIDEAKKSNFDVGNLKWFENSEKAAEYLSKDIKSNTIVLVKGSNGMEMKKIIDKFEDKTIS